MGVVGGQTARQPDSDGEKGHKARIVVVVVVVIMIVRIRETWSGQ